MKTITIESVKEKYWKIVEEYEIFTEQTIDTAILGTLLDFVEQSIKEGLEANLLHQKEINTVTSTNGTEAVKNPEDSYMWWNEDVLRGYNKAVRDQQELIDKYLNKK